MDISYMSRLAAQAFAADDFALAAELAAEARATVEGADPDFTVLQLDDGRLAVCPKSALTGPDVNIPALNARLAKELDDVASPMLMEQGVGPA